jgi:hypothetical protein
MLGNLKLPNTIMNGERRDSFETTNETCEYHNRLLTKRVRFSIGNYG